MFFFSQVFFFRSLDESSSQPKTINTIRCCIATSISPSASIEAQGCFQAAINCHCEHIPKVRAYQDGIILGGSIRVEHDQNLHNLFKALHHHNVSINAKKPVFSVQSLKYLVHLLSSGGISADSDQTQVLREFKPPTNVKQLRSFLGFAQGYSKFVPHFAHKALLYNSFSKDDFTWTKQHSLEHHLCGYSQRQSPK